MRKSTKTLCEHILSSKNQRHLNEFDHIIKLLFEGGHQNTGNLRLCNLWLNFRLCTLGCFKL